MTRKKKHKSPHPHHQAASTAPSAPGLAPQPEWGSRPRFTSMQVASIVAKHLVPLVALWLLGGSAENFLLLSVFTIALTIVGTGIVGVGVSTRQVQGHRDSADAIAAWAVLVLVGAMGTLLLTAMFGWVIALVAAQAPGGLLNASLGWGVLAVLLAVLPELVLNYRADLAAKLPEEVRKKRDQPAIGGQLLCAGILFVLSGYLGESGRSGAVIIAIVLTALFILRDLRPDRFRLNPQ